MIDCANRRFDQQFFIEQGKAENGPPWLDRTNDMKRRNLLLLFLAGCVGAFAIVKSKRFTAVSEPLAIDPASEKHVYMNGWIVKR